MKSTAPQINEPIHDSHKNFHASEELEFDAMEVDAESNLQKNNFILNEYEIFLRKRILGLRKYFLQLENLRSLR